MRFRRGSPNTDTAYAAHDSGIAGRTGSTQSRARQKPGRSSRMAAAISAKAARDGRSEMLALEATYANQGTTVISNVKSEM